MKDGIIELNTEVGKSIGFTTEKFTSVSYLWKTGNRITISFIESKISGKGYLRELFHALEEKGYEIAVPTAFPKMKKICLKYGFRKAIEYDPDMGDVEMLIRKSRVGNKTKTIGEYK